MILAVDTETTGLYIKHGCRPFMVIAHEAETDTCYCWEWDVNTATRSVTPNKDDIDEIQALLDSADKLIFHNALFDAEALASVGITVDWSKVEDTLHLCHLYDASSPKGLKFQASIHCDILDSDESKLHEAIIEGRKIARKLGWRIASKNLPEFYANKGPKASTKGLGYGVCDYWLPRALAVDDLSLPREWVSLCATYGIGDVVRTSSLYSTLLEKLEAKGIDPNLAKLNDRLLPIYAEIESRGVYIDHTSLTAKIGSLDRQARNHKRKAEKIAKLENCNSDKQLRKYLFETHNLTPIKTTATGLPSVDKDTLEHYLHSDNANTLPVKSFLKHRIIYSALSKEQQYLESYQRASIGDTVYPRYNLVGTDTTRLSSENPNTTNVKNKDNPFLADLGINSTKPRSVFGPRDGRVWLSTDYSQLQVVIAATLAGEIEFVEGLLSGEVDVHADLATVIFDLPPNKEAEKAQRTIAKNCNFGYLFGAGRYKIDIETAKKGGIYDILQKRFPNAHKQIKANEIHMRRKGYVLTAGGYPLVPPQPHKATVYRVQGTEGEITKHATYRIHKLAKRKGLDIKVAIPVHDELNFDLPADLATPKIVRMLENEMIAAANDFGIKVNVETNIHKENWQDGVKYEMG